MTNAKRLSSIAAVGVAAASCAAWMVASPATANAATMPCSSAARACVDLATQEAWLAHDGKVVYGPVKVRTGRPSFPTAPGTFHVSYKDRDHVSSVYHTPMPYSVFFNGGDAFHEGSLAVSSHGCVHLSHAAAVRFYDTLHTGDEVQVVR
ncbi:MAG TPA: L,D-transpeptidase [Pseudonocardiaceae bacterium]|nr:L,D-transpeptidase [Pseudonocardiaceae bacterium]